MKHRLVVGQFEISDPNRYLLRRGLYWAYNALISTDCLALRGVSPFLTSFFESENCVGCSS